MVQRNCVGHLLVARLKGEQVVPKRAKKNSVGVNTLRQTTHK
jgi:hypothetical protein